MNRTKWIQIVSLVIAIFLTSCIRGNLVPEPRQESWKFAVLCDTRGDNKNTQGKECVNSEILKKIAGDIVAENCEVVIVPGDLVNGWWANGGMSYKDEFKSWKQAMSPVYAKKIPVFTVRGNHEAGPGTEYPPKPPYDITPDEKLKKIYLEEFGETNPPNGPDLEKGLTYYFIHKNALFVAFDAYINPNRLNLDWFNGVLEKRSADTTPHLFTFSHCPAFKVVHPDCLAYYEKQRNAFWNTIAANGGRFYFCGHDHMYNRASIKADDGTEVFQVVVGSCGAPFKSWTPPYEDPNVKNCIKNEKDNGYMVVTVTGNRATGIWKSLAPGGVLPWTQKDSVSYSVAAPSK